MLSIILPTYNEALGIQHFLNELSSKIPSNIDYEIIVIDDESPDCTLIKVQEYASNTPTVRPFLNTRPKGLAFSIQSGIDQANGDVICVMDSDGTHDPTYISIMHDYMNQCDMVVGSRFVSGGRMRPWYYYFVSFLLNRILRIFLKVPTKDVTSGFFMIRTRVIRELDLTKIFWGFGDYFYILLAEVYKSNLKILEFPVKYRQREHDIRKSRRFRMLFSYIIRAFKYRTTIKSVINKKFNE